MVMLARTEDVSSVTVGVSEKTREKRPINKGLWLGNKFTSSPKAVGQSYASCFELVRVQLV